MEYDNIKEALEVLVDYNDSKLNSKLAVNGRKATVKDVQDFNEEVLTNIADLLGMSSLYLK